MKKKRLLVNLITFFLLFIVYCLLFTEPAEAIGLGVKPKRIDLKVMAGRETTTEILVINISNEPALFQVYPEGLEEVISVSPKDFRLEASASQIVKVTILAKGGGQLATNLAVLTKPLGSTGFPVSPGAKIPVNLEVSTSFWGNLKFIIFGGFLICLSAIFIVKLKGRRNQV